MPVVIPPQYVNAQPEYWGDRTDIPTLDMYEGDVAKWQDAMQAYWDQHNTENPMYQGDQVSTYTRADGSQGEWYTAGISPNSPNAGLSEGAILANQMNSKLRIHQDGPGLFVALQNMVQTQPDKIQAMYEAFGPDGKPLLEPAVLAMLERLGVRPSAGITVPRETPRVINVPDGAFDGPRPRTIRGTDRQVDPNHPNGPGQHPSDPIPPYTPPTQPGMDHVAPDGTQVGGDVAPQGPPGTVPQLVPSMHPGPPRPRTLVNTEASPMASVQTASAPYLQGMPPINSAAIAPEKAQAIVTALAARGLPPELIQDDGDVYDETYYPAWMQRARRRSGRRTNAAPPIQPLNGLDY